MGDSGEGLVDAEARIQERMEEREADRRRTTGSVPAVDPDYKYQTVIILLTDGLNTEDRWYTSQSSIDTRQQKTCDNIKAASITLYTVQVNTGGDATSTMLQNCASDSSKFFLLTTAGQIVTTFGQIGTSLSKLRLAM